MEQVFIKKYWDEGQTLNYLHYVDGWAMRQIEITPDKDSYFSIVNPNDVEYITDQPLDKSDMQEEDYITEAEFDHRWNNRPANPTTYEKWGWDSNIPG
jgi:hypothetical protein